MEAITLAPPADSPNPHSPATTDANPRPPNVSERAARPPFPGDAFGGALASTLVDVMGFQSFERSLSNMVEVVFTRSNRSNIRPVELGRRLLREMDDHRSVDVHGRRTVPNSFVFHLSPRDHAGFAEIEQALKHELSEAAREYARDEGYHLAGAVHVTLVVDNSLKPGRFGIQSSMTDTASAREPAQAVPPEPPAAPPRERITPPRAPIADQQWAAQADAPPIVVPFEPSPVSIDPPPVGATQAAVGLARLQMPSGQRVNLDSEIISIGRLPECTITLTDANVSRRHAEIHPGEQVRVVDLGSTNGTKVNGLRIQGQQVLADGDIISLGGTHLRFEAARASA